MIVLLSCRDFAVIRELLPGEDVRVACAAEELKRSDGRAVVASLDGKIIADADGWREMSLGPPPYDAATATGMYDPEG